AGAADEPGRVPRGVGLDAPADSRQARVAQGAHRLPEAAAPHGHARPAPAEAEAVLRRPERRAARTSGKNVITGTVVALSREAAGGFEVGSAAPPLYHHF